ncbi:MAG: molybdopterin molybdotransferase MoeA [Candidatus Omnitrophota bacterium]|nr:molybdopterin molybdotransferase MoeA [Candidatus Omnitrophota bacterium]
MITINEAQTRIQKSIPPLRTETLPLGRSLGYILAEDIRAGVDLPTADNSAMDGFILRSRDTASASAVRPVRLRIRGAIKAGDRGPRLLAKGEAYRIMTGAFIPRGGDTVLIKENAVIEKGKLVIAAPLKPGSHIRRRGEELRKGSKILKMGGAIHPGIVGILASVGRDRIKVFTKPRVSVIATGSELVEPGRRLRRGQIYNSNAWMIWAALQSMGVTPVAVMTARDQLSVLKTAVKKALGKSDLVIIMGGVSVGDYDFVKDVLGGFGVRQIFWKVKQKPGKPLYFGKQGRALVFGLPGNPASVFTCFYEYVFGAIRQMSGFRRPYLRRENVMLQTPIRGDAKRSLLLKAKMSTRFRKRTIAPLGFQASHMISSLRDTDSFIVIPPGRKTVARGKKATADLLPYAVEVES